MLGMKFLRDIFGEAVALDLGTVNTLAAIRNSAAGAQRRGGVHGQ